MGAILELAIFPMDKGDSVSEFVAEVIRVIDESGLPHQTGPMGTCIEGDVQELMELCTRCFKALEPYCERVYATMKVDYRKGRSDGLASKLESLGRRL